MNEIIEKYEEKAMNFWKNKGYFYIRTVPV